MDPYYQSLLDMIPKKVYIKLENGRELEGTLMSADNIGNVVIADTVELNPGHIVPSDYKPRKLGTAVVRSQHIFSINLCTDKTF